MLESPAAAQRRHAGKSLKKTKAAAGTARTPTEKMDATMKKGIALPAPCSTRERLICQIIEVVETEFGIGFVSRIEQLYGGYTNLSFSVSTYKDGRTHKIFFRKYWKGVPTNTIEFEHALLDHVIGRGARSVAGLIRSRDGRGYVRRVELVDGKEQEYYFAAFQFIEGCDKYSWTRNDLNDAECASAGGVLAELHNASSDFSAGALALPREPVGRILSKLAGTFGACAAVPDGKLLRYFLQNLPALLCVTQRCEAALSLATNIPSIGIHGDFHPGNQKYFADRVVGMFDFDRANIDLRIFDVAMAIIYFCTIWGGASDGQMRLGKLATFLKAYQLRTGAAPLGAMSPAELRHFPDMLAAANLTLVKWVTVDNFFSNGSTCDEEEYLSYLRHHIRLMRWIEGRQKEISQALKAL